MWCTLCGEGQREEALLSSPLFHSLKLLGIFYFCHHCYQHEHTHISTLTKNTETCILPASPTIFLSSLIIMRYSKEIPGFKSWYIILYYLLLQGMSLQYCNAIVFDTLLLAFILAYFKYDVSVVCLHCSFY